MGLGLALAALVGALLVWIGRPSDPRALALVGEVHEGRLTSSAPGLVDPHGASQERVASAPGLEDAPEPSGTDPILSGRIVDSHGDPVADARVLVAHETEWWNIPLHVDLDQGTDSDRYRRVEVRSTTDGRFQFHGLRPGRTKIAVCSEGFAPLELEARALLEAGGLDLGDLTLDLGLRLAGLVEDWSGEPVGKARLSLEVAPSGMSFGGSRYVHLAETDAEGRFESITISPGEWRLRIESSEHPPGWFKGANYVTGIADGITFRLERPWPISGRLEVPGVEDLSAYYVRAKFLGDPKALPSFGSKERVQSVDCAADGDFSFCCLRAMDGTTQYELKAYRGAGKGARTVCPPLQAQVGSTAVLLRAAPMASLTFELYDAQDRKPISAPEVWLFTNLAHGQRVDLLARGSLTQVEQGRFRVRDSIYAEGYSDFVLRIDCPGYRTYYRSALDWTPGFERDLGPLEMRRASTLTVKVVDSATRAPIEGAEVQRLSSAPSSARKALERQREVYLDPHKSNGTTDSAGRVVLSVAAGFPYQLEASHPGHASLLTTGHADVAADEEITLELARGGTLIARVEDGNGEPQAGQSIGLVLPGDDLEVTGALFLGGARQRSLQTDEAGIARFEHVRPGPAEVTLYSGDEDQRAVIVEEGRTEELLFQVASRGSVRVLVRESGAALVAAEVSIYTAGEGIPGELWAEASEDAGKTDSNGRVQLDGLLPGEHFLRINHGTRDLHSTSRLLVGPTNPLTVVDLTTTSVEGQVLAPGGGPAIDCPVFILTESDATETMLRYLVSRPDRTRASSRELGMGMTRTDDGGRFRFRGLPTSVSMHVGALAPDAQLVLSPSFSLAPDAVHSLAPLHPSPAGSITIHLELTRGKAWYYEAVLEPIAPTVSPSGVRRNHFKSAGHTSLQNLAPGEWLVRIQTRWGITNGLTAEVRATIAPGKQAEITIRQ